MSAEIGASVSLILGVVFICSGALKLGKPVDLEELAALGVPPAIIRRWLAVGHAWAELVLGVALILLGGALAVAATAAATAVMLVYLVIVWRAHRAPHDLSCACFGASKPVTALTVIRNGWLLLCALTALVLAASLLGTSAASPTFGGPLAALWTSGQAWWIVMAAAAALTTALIVHESGRPVRAAAERAALPADAAPGEDLDYVRVRTPSLPVTLGDGSPANLRDLTTQRPLLLLAVRDGCSSCALALTQLERWRALVPAIDVRLLISDVPDRSSHTEITDPMSVHDPHRYIVDTLGPWGTPTAVLFGVDGLLAGGPVSGVQDIDLFIADIAAALSEDAPRGDEAAVPGLPVADDAPVAGPTP